MNQRAWAIKLGSGGSAVSFCERHCIVGVGWQDVKPTIVMHGDREELWRHVREVYAGDSRVSDRTIGSWVGQIFRFARECSEGDYILYYDPPKKWVRICRVKSPCAYRDFDTGDRTDVWYFWRVEYPLDPIPILDFYGSLKGKLLGPRMSFWQLNNSYDIVDALVRGLKPHLLAAPDSELQAAYSHLRDLVSHRLEAFGEHDWELLVVDYLKAQGAHVNESEIGGSRPIIDAEARFDHGEFGEDVWRVQVKRLQNQEVDWPQIEQDLNRVGDARFCYVSAFGFTAAARQKAYDEGVRLLEGRDFALFVLGNKVRSDLQRKLLLPFAVTA